MDKAGFHNDVSRASNLYLFAMQVVSSKLHSAKLPR
jgi:hypothetical protein